MLRNTTNTTAKVNPTIDYARQMMILNYLLEGVLGDLLSDLDEAYIEEAIARVTRHLESATEGYRLDQVFRNRATIHKYGAEMLDRLANHLPIEFAADPRDTPAAPEITPVVPHSERLAQAKSTAKVLGNRVGQVAVNLGSRTGQVARRGAGGILSAVARTAQEGASRLTPKG